MFLAALLLANTPAPAPAPMTDLGLTGDYVEARTASVYAGACHYGGEYTTAGREAVLGWHVGAGEVNGVDLGGVDVVAVVSADVNLAEGAEGVGAKRRTVLYLDSAATPEQRDAARAWLAAERSDLLGDVVRVKVAPVDVARDGDAFRLSAGGDVALSGAAMPERECCKMSYNVWYEPFVPVEGRLVGNTVEFRVRERALDRTWSRPGENAVFFGAF